ncbi:hypothetical protein MN116_007342, partial [Schistosoma mekongi]
ITFYTKEHPKVNTLLGNLYTLNPILTNNTIHSIQLKTFNIQLTKCFHLDRRTGNLYTTILAETMLDSEKICIQNKNSKIFIKQQFNEVSIKQLCTINLLVTINNRLIISIIIQIEDINDNSPQFLDNNIQTVYINESSLPELTKIPIKPAYDADFNGYNKLYYYLNYISNHETSLINSMHTNDNPFRLIDTLKVNDTNDMYSLQLILIKPLDYEIQSKYTLNLTVCDNQLDRMYTLHMDIIHCTSKLINIHVNNVNDELPWFEQTNYSIIIYETLPIDSEILKVTAYDNDSEPYNRIHYRLIPSYDMIISNVKDLFRINLTTGVISLGKTILKPGIYKLLIEAYDEYLLTSTSIIDNIQHIDNKSSSSPPSPVVHHRHHHQYSQNIAHVYIHVLDVNNHAPIIEIQHTQDTLLYYANDYYNHTKLLLLKLYETIPLNTSIVYFKITDEDELHNAKINYEYYPIIEFINSSLCTSIKLKYYHNHSYVYDINIPENIPLNSYIIQIIAKDYDISK